MFSHSSGRNHSCLEEISRMGLQKQRCKVCWNADGFNFHVPDAIWKAVVPQFLQHRAVCLSCFDRMVTEREIDYAPHLGTIYFAGEKIGLALSIQVSDNCYSDA